MFALAAVRFATPPLDRVSSSGHSSPCHPVPSHVVILFGTPCDVAGATTPQAATPHDGVFWRHFVTGLAVRSPLLRASVHESLCKAFFSPNPCERFVTFTLARATAAVTTLVQAHVIVSELVAVFAMSLVPRRHKRKGAPIILGGCHRL